MVGTNSRRLVSRRATDIDRAVGERIRARRVALGIPIQQLAERIGVTYQQVHKYETCRNRLSTGQLVAICRALAIEPGELLKDLAAVAASEPGALARDQMALARDAALLPARHRRALVQFARGLAGGRS
jgi:transcriptional regulator with XRE-family HTH domain